MAFTPTEIYMHLPDVVAVVVRDTPPIKGVIVAHEEDESATTYGTWYDREDPRDSVTRKATIVGPTKSYYRFQDQNSTEFLDRPDATTVGNWTFTGGTINKVVIMSEPYDHSLEQHTGNAVQCVFEHTLLLHLNADLTEGSYTVSNATADIPSTPFVFDDTVTRAGGINVNQVGYRPSDIYKYGILAQRLPSGPNAGVVDFDDYGFVDEDFYILDASKTPVYTGTVSLRVAASTSETNYTSIYVADAAAPLTVTSISNHASTPTVTTSGAHGLATNDRVRFRGMPASFSALGEGGSHPVYVATVTGANTFTVPHDTSGMGTYTTGFYLTASGGYDSLVYPCVLMNKAGTNTYDLDFSDFTPADADTSYYIQIPGYGISDPFLLHEAAHAIAFGRVHEGFFAQRRGIAVAAGEYTRGANFRDDGVTHFRNYRTRQTATTAYEGNAVQTFNSGLSVYAPTVTTERITLTDSGWGLQDAGDVDTHLNAHMQLFFEMASMILDVPQAARITPYEVPLSSEAIGSRYDGTDDWPPIMHELAWFMDFWLSLQQEDGSVLSGLQMGPLQTPLYTEPSDLYHGVNSKNYTSHELTGSGTTVHGAILSPDHPSNYCAVMGFAVFSLLCTDYGNTTLAAAYKQAAIDAWDWAESIHASHLGDEVARDAHYDTYLGFKQLPMFHAGADPYLPITINSVDTSANTAAIGGWSDFAIGMKVGVYAGGGTLPGGLSENTDYWVYYDNNVVSFHNNSTDAGTGANKIDLTAGFSAGPCIFRTMTDAEYSTCMDNVQAQCGNAVQGIRVDAAGALLRCIGWNDGGAAALKALFTPGSPGPGKWATFHYMRAGRAAGVDPGDDDVIDYAFGDNGFGPNTEPGAQYDSTANFLEYNESPTVSAFPAAHKTDVDGVFQASMFEGAWQWRLLIDSVEEAQTTQRNKLLRNMQAGSAFLLGCNSTGRSSVSGVGERIVPVMLHEDSFSRGLRHPDGIPAYGWFLWPQTGGAQGSSSQDWVGHNVSSGSDPYKLVEPWKYAEPYWPNQVYHRGLINVAEYSIGTSMWGGALPLLASHLWDSNEIYQLGEAEITYNSAGLRFRWHT